MSVRVQASGFKGLGLRVSDVASESWGFKVSYSITPVGYNEITYDVDIRHYSTHHPPQQ